MLRLALAVAVLAVPAALPGFASAASGFRCTAVPVSGTVVGQTLPAPVVGSPTEDCVAGSAAPALTLPDPLAGLVTVDAVNGVTAVNDDGAYAGAGLANLRVGSIPVALPPITVPDALKSITLSTQIIPGIGPLIPVATVDLTPAIDAITSLPSRNLLEAGVLYSQAFGSCADGKPVLSGDSRIAGASVLGLPVDASKTIDSAANLVDTTQIAASALDLNLARVSILGGLVTVDRALELLRPVLATLPPVTIPAQVAQVKLTPPTQQAAGGALVQRALRAEITLAGQSIADLSIGTVALSGGRCTEAATPIAPDVPTTAPASEVALACTTRKLALIDVVRSGRRVRLYGAADKSLAGETVRIIFQATGRIVARVRVAPDGSFTTTAPLPSRRVRDTNRARYVAEAGGERSLNLKLSRRMIVTSIASRGNRVTIRGKVVRPLAKPIAPIVLKRRVTCETLETVKTFKPRRDGSFSVTVTKPANLAATVYRLQTRVRRTSSSTKTSPTFTLPRAVDL